MGYYIETQSSRNKAQYLIDKYDAEAVSFLVAEQAFNEGYGIVCVMDNGLFEAAGFAYSRDELEAFAYPDGRPKTWLKMDRTKAAQLSGYAG